MAKENPSIGVFLLYGDSKRDERSYSGFMLEQDKTGITQNNYKADTVKSADKPSALFVPTHNLKSPGSTP